ncbi:glycine zipper 2TM domain-containing protein [Qipengyuania flava]|uniref:glycine zipper 2TM domain-containing protein n=1 Tax=Qipengyuania flava TaxID=192812 RepID=UPI001C62F61B|nr:glycine zipper 2TM domain-containing protein [Qipengyuania flava]QYJ08231.1 glycine zipper 2TM domain-containing protein [Qipengyuania flava]
MSNLFKTAALAIAASGLAAAAPVSAAPALHASPAAHAAVVGDMTYEHKRKRGHGHYRDRDYRDYRDYRGYRDRRDYRDYRDRRDARPYYMGYDRYYGQPVRADTRIWRGNDGRYYCRRDNGTTGLLVGAGVGALLGHEVAGRGDRTLGAILGGAAGALLGRTIDRSSTRCG